MRFAPVAGLVLLLTTFAVGCASEEVAMEDESDLYSEDDDRSLPDEPNEYETTPGVSLSTLARGNGDDDGVDLTPHFSSPERPGKNPSRDRRIQSHLSDLINGTPKGEEIRISAFLLANEEGEKIAKELVRAHDERNVLVRVVQDGQNTIDDDADKSDNSGADVSSYLKRHLGGDYVRCKRQAALSPEGNQDKSGSCIAKAGGRMHAKIALFSKTNGRKNVVWIASANLNSYSGTRMFNNSLTVRGDARLYDGMQEYFSDLIHQRSAKSGDDYYDPKGTGKGYVEGAGGTVKVHASPEAQGDLVIARLDNIEPSKGCKIRLAESHLSGERTNVIDKLEELGAKGCSVQLVATPQNVGKAVRERLTDGKHTHIAVKTLETHDKVITIYAKWNGSAKRKKVVLAGSHNLALSANRENDEVLSVVEDNRVYNRYTKHVLKQWRHDDAKEIDTSARKPAAHVVGNSCAEVVDGYYCSEELGLARGEILNCIDGKVVGSAPCPNTCASLRDEAGTAQCE